jgi:alpha-amylase
VACGLALSGTVTVGLTPAGAAKAGKQVAKKALDDRTAAEAAPTGGWWDNRTFYEIFVRSFADANGDGIGDLNGAASRLAYLKQLGVGAVWLMPITQGDTYHGYSVTDYRAVESDYGTLDDMRAYLKAAHDLDIKVIVDLVLNHTSDRHPWFIDAQKPGSPKTNWYRWADKDPGQRGPWGQRVWHRAANGRWYFALFDRSQPDLNLANPAVTKEMVNIARFWLQDVGVDGFRLDAASHLIEQGAQMENTSATKAWWRSFRAQVKAVRPDAFLIGEVNGPARPASTYVPAGLDATFQFDLAKGFVSSVLDQNPAALNSEQIVGASLYGAGAQFGSFLSNHDQNRIGELGDTARARVAAAELLTRPGIPFLYYGEEIGVQGHKPDESIRTPMPWTAGPGGGFTAGTPWEALGSGQGEGRTVEAQQGVPASLLESYRSLIRLRQEQTALQDKGSWHKVQVHIQPAGGDGGIGGTLGMDAYVRALDSQRFLVIHNLAAAAVTQWGGDAGPIEIAVRIESGAGTGTVSGAKSVLSLGWDRVADPKVTAAGAAALVTISGPVPGSSTLVLALS